MAASAFARRLSRGGLGAPAADVDELAERGAHREVVAQQPHRFGVARDQDYRGLHMGRRVAHVLGHLLGVVRP